MEIIIIIVGLVILALWGQSLKVNQEHKARMYLANKYDEEQAELKEESLHPSTVQVDMDEEDVDPRTINIYRPKRKDDIVTKVTTVDTQTMQDDKTAKLDASKVNLGDLNLSDDDIQKIMDIIVQAQINKDEIA